MERVAAVSMIPLKYTKLMLCAQALAQRPSLQNLSPRPPRWHEHEPVELDPANAPLSNHSPRWLSLTRLLTAFERPPSPRNPTVASFNRADPR